MNAQAWHYTCDHGHLGIEADRQLRPGPIPIRSALPDRIGGG